MANSVTTTPLHQYKKVVSNSLLRRVSDIIILFLLTFLIIYRLLSLHNHGFVWLLALLCESWFTFVWIIKVNIKWDQVEYKTCPQHVSQRVEELPRVDIFVTTADAVLEPPIITVNTVLSLLAVDYPAKKLACYVSDDGCSPLTYYSLVEASKFAKLWVPFCKKCNVQVRAPFRYFSDQNMAADETTLEFQQERTRMMDEYDELRRKIKDAAQTYNSWDLSGDLEVFSNTQRTNHPTIIKVITEDEEGLSHGLPLLLYISRGKCPKHSHHYKAGALNVLARVSGIITNAPFMLNVDCDNFANNPLLVHEAMCLFFGSKDEKESGFVQFMSSNLSNEALKDDPFGNQSEVWINYWFHGLAALQGPLYVGSGCFHRRKVIYGLSPENIANKGRNLTPIHGNLSDEKITKIFGNSEELSKSTAQALQGHTSFNNANNYSISKLVESAYQVAGSAYEHGTAWGTQIGWFYGSTSEDALTGLRIHARGWKSLLATPDPCAFIGSAPSRGPASLTQQKRWATGLLEILFSKNNYIIALFTANLQFRQCLGYFDLTIWGLRSIPELCYMLLPAYCIITNSNFLPKEKEAVFYVYVALFVSYYLYTLIEYMQAGLTVHAWWNNERMMKINSVSAWLFALFSMALKVLGISETVFEITQKDESASSSDDGGRFTFDGSPTFVPGTTLLLIHFTALGVAMLGLQPLVEGGDGSGVGEMGCSVMVVLFFWPFVKGLFEKGKYGIPLSTICKSALLAFVVLNLWRSTC